MTIFSAWIGTVHCQPGTCELGFLPTPASSSSSSSSRPQQVGAVILDDVDFTSTILDEVSWVAGLDDVDFTSTIQDAVDFTSTIVDGLTFTATIVDRGLFP